MAGFSDPAAADKLEGSLKNAKDVIIYRYPEQGHAFLNDDDWSIEKRKELGFVQKEIEPRSAEQAVRDEAWERIYNYFIKHLGDGMPSKF
jgi:carboxymethylenebutenolidase